MILSVFIEKCRRSFKNEMIEHDDISDNYSTINNHLNYYAEKGLFKTESLSQLLLSLSGYSIL